MLSSRLKFRLGMGVFCVLAWFVPAAYAQQAAPVDTKMIRSSAAYAEVVLRRTEVGAEVESMVLEYTEEYPKLKELRHELLLLTRETDRLLKLKPDRAGSLTQALGKLIVRKVEAELDLWRLQQVNADGHPDVKRAKRKVEVFENAVKEILG